MKPGQLIDVSHAVEHGMITYKGLPAPLVCDFLSREQSRAASTPRASSSTSARSRWSPTPAPTSTRPFHRYADGTDLADLPLEKLANLDAVVVRRPDAAGPSTPASLRGLRRARQGGAGPHRLGPATGAPTSTSRATRS